MSSRLNELVADVDARQADEVLNSLRSGIPPQRFVSSYSSGWDDFLGQVARRHLQPGRAGRVRFISGSYGSGKTHLLRLLTERAFMADFLVTTVTLSKDEAPLSKFEMIFSRLVRGITSGAMYREGDLRRDTPFGEVLRRGLVSQALAEEPMAATVARARGRLMADETIDADVRRAVCAFWETFIPRLEEADEVTALDEQRALLLQWFCGEGRLTHFKALGLKKMVDRANSPLLLTALCRLAQHLGHAGLLVLLDEADMSYALMTSKESKVAHTNLLHLINEAEHNAGLVIIYAAVPEYYVAEHGVQQYGALAQRMGKLPESRPRALDRIWNVDAAEHAVEDYQQAAWRLRELYRQAEPEDEELLPSRAELDGRVAELIEKHPKFSQISAWRMLITRLVADFDTAVQGGEIPAPRAAEAADPLAGLRD